MLEVTGHRSERTIAMRWSVALPILTLTVATLTFAKPAPAMADGTPLTICNRTDKNATFGGHTFGFAFGYYTPGINDTPHILTGPFVSRGWLSVPVEQCVSAPNPFGARYMFWWADYQYVYGPIGDFGLDPNTAFCITPDDTTVAWLAYAKTHPTAPEPPHHFASFTFEDENASKSVCERGVNWWVPVRKVDTLVDATVNYEGT